MGGSSAPEREEVVAHYHLDGPRGAMSDTGQGWKVRCTDAGQFSLGEVLGVEEALESV